MQNLQELGKIFLLNNGVYSIVGYDFMSNLYLLKRIDTNYNNYIKMDIKYKNKEKSYDEIIKYFNNMIEKEENKQKDLEYLLNLSIKIKENITIKHYLIEFCNLFSRYNETLINLKFANMNMKHYKKQEEIDEFNKEIKAIQKGLYRVEKRLKHFYKENYELVIKILKDNNIRTLSELQYIVNNNLNKIQYYEECKISFIENYNKLKKLKNKNILNN